ncbi:acyl carrier protein [Streptomyces lasiicapitis]|uniref:Phosphopantetheine-binding protein n=1 Tax=Streptomyces lasiicapitis TaxID=1923961 RepID=A0ABQ2MN90_9ACTN|nr:MULTISPECIES: acyl carrier protein [Streptomyces]QIB47697.1 acyl carrier protein [Streptomyces aureoverticillatus]GGO54804.1 phosphopantetheine-binding protein [Streptomyces lasiicapitis]
MTQPVSGPITLDELQSWLVERVGEYVPDLDEKVDPNQELGEYGLDSVAVVAFAADVEDWLGIRVEPSAVWDHPTVTQLAKFLLTEREQQAA